MSKERKVIALTGYIGKRLATSEDRDSLDLIFREQKRNRAVIFIVSEESIALQTKKGLYLLPNSHKRFWKIQVDGTKIHIRIKETNATVTYWA
jgi:hypothetical protein